MLLAEVSIRAVAVVLQSWNPVGAREGTGQSKTRDWSAAHAHISPARRIDQICLV